jgi:hypothetical protein
VKRTACSILGALCLLGCDSGPPAPPAQPAQPAPAPAPAATREGPARVQPGTARVERSGARYTVLANGAAPRGVLDELARAAGFRVEPGAASLAGAPLHLALRDATAEEVLARVLRGERYDLHYEPVDGDLSPERPFDGRPVTLARVSLRGAPAAAAPAAAPAPPAARGGLRRRGGEEAREAPDDAERERLAQERAEREHEREEAVARDWRDPRPEVRLGAIEQMDVERDEDRARLEQLLRADPAPDVRVAAAEALADGSPFAATEPLLGALGDRDPRVVAGVVDALEDVYDEAPDPRIRARVEELSQHRDAAVREAVARFEEWAAE